MNRLAISVVMSCVVLLCVSALIQADEYLIKPGDALGVTVLGEADLTRRVVVGPEGGITLLLANEIQVGGLTTTQAAKEIAKQLKAFIKNPVVSVEVVEQARMQVTVSGEVKSPGIYPVAAGARLVDVITAAGGYTPAADLSKVKISRGGGTAVTVDLSKFLLSGDAAANVPVSGGDTIIVPASDLAPVGTVMIMGAVRQTGSHPLAPGMTVREAVMLAGGPTEFADLRNVTLRHEGSAETIAIDYPKAASGDSAANVQLKPGDVIYIAVHEQLGSYTIQGAVGAPGRYDIKGKTSLTEAIAIAGGVRDRAKLNDVRILRSSADGPMTLKANVGDIMSGTAENVLVYDGDSILVPMGKAKTDLMRILSIAVSIGWLLTRN